MNPPSNLSGGDAAALARACAEAARAGLEALAWTLAGWERAELDEETSPGSMAAGKGPRGSRL